MLQEQKERIIQIIEGIQLSTSVPIQGLKHIPDSLENIDLPACLPLPTPVNPERMSANRFKIPCTWELFLYVRRWGEGNSAQAAVEPLELFDYFLEAFLTRPQLQYGGSNLNGIVGNATFRNTQGLNIPLIFPPNSRQGLEYVGGKFELSLTQVQTYNINVSGA